MLPLATRAQESFLSSKNSSWESFALDGYLTAILLYVALLTKLATLLMFVSAICPQWRTFKPIAFSSILLFCYFKWGDFYHLLPEQTILIFLRISPLLTLFVFARLKEPVAKCIFAPFIANDLWITYRMGMLFPPLH